MDEIGLTESISQGCPVVALSGELRAGTAPDLRDVLMKHVKRRVQALVLDMSKLEFMDTSGLATLIETHLRIEKSGGRLVIFGLQPQIAGVFDVTHVARLFSIFDTQEAALEFLTGAEG